MSYSATSQTAAQQASLSFTVSWSLLKFKSFESVILSSHFILCCLLLLLPSIFPSIRVFSNELVLPIRFPKSQIFTWNGQSIRASASASVLPMNIQDWFLLGLMGFDLPPIHGTLKNLCQHHSLKASILWCSFF